MNIQTGRKTTGAKPITPQSLAHQMLSEANGDLNAATTKMVNFIKSIPSERLMDEVLTIGARKLLNESVVSERAGMARVHASTEQSAFIKAPFRMNDSARRAQGRVRAMGANATSALMNVPYVIDGVRRALKDWTGSEVLTHGETQLMQGSTTVRNARYLISVGRAAGAKKIGDALDAATVEGLKREADSSDV